jgi:hypothetical protein
MVRHRVATVEVAPITLLDLGPRPGLGWRLPRRAAPFKVAMCAAGAGAVHSELSGNRRLKRASADRLQALPPEALAAFEEVQREAAGSVTP